MITSKDYDSSLVLINGANGVYIPEIFYQNFDFKSWGLEKSDFSDLESEENEAYWETWESLLDKAQHKLTADLSGMGLVYTLWQDGDLFAMCPELMTDEEYQNFFGEGRC